MSQDPTAPAADPDHAHDGARTIPAWFIGVLVGLPTALLLVITMGVWDQSSTSTNSTPLPPSR